MTGSLVVILRLVVIILWLLVLGRVLLSWVDPMGRTQLGRALFRATEPILAPIRSVLPRTGMLDISPLVLALVLSIVLRSIL